MTAEEQFKKYSGIWIKNGISNVVPVIGSGVNLQAEKLEGKNQGLNWDTLIKEIISETGIPSLQSLELPDSFIRKWETVLRIVTVNTRGYKPYLTEKDLQKKVQFILNYYEESCKNYDLYKVILNTKFKDIISLNFDRCLALAGQTRTITSLSNEKSKDGTTLYRHSLINRKKSSTRIWYPHGDTKRLDTIKLGVRKYGTYINWIESLRGSYMHRWNEEDEIYCKYNERSWIPPNEWDSTVRSWTKPSSWVNIFKSAPLLFIGCSLLPDEWPLWYLLNQRARQTAFLDQKGSPDDRPETIVLTAGKTRPIHLLNHPEYIVNIHFESYDKMWKTVTDFFENGKNRS
ncbi:MAG: hypothetical protein AB8B74_01460 [Crocinitomicaceae bacterium]